MIIRFEIEGKQVDLRSMGSIVYNNERVEYFIASCKGRVPKGTLAKLREHGIDKLKIKGRRNHYFCDTKTFISLAKKARRQGR